MANGSPAYSGRAMPIRCCAKSAYICQGRVAFALAKVLREIVGHRKPMWYSRADCARKLTSMSRNDSRPVNCAKAMAKN